MEVGTMPTEMMDVDSLAVDRLDLETPALQPTGSVVRSELNECHVLDLLIILSRHKQIILGATLAAAVLAAIVSLLLPNRYTATANILPPQQSPSLAASMIGQLGALGAMAQKDLGLKNPNDLYVGMLRSRTAEDALIRRFDLLRVYRDKRMSDGRRDLESATSIVLGKEGFVTISVEDKDRSRAPQIANAYVEQLRKLTQDLAVTEAGQRRLFFERQLELAKNNLADAEQALKETEQKTGLIQLDGQAKAIIEAVVKLRALMAAKEVELHAMRLFATEQNPDVMLGEQELSGLRAKQYEAARLDEAKTAAIIQVVDPAIEPDRKSSPPRTLIVVIAALLGFFGSAGC